MFIWKPHFEVKNQLSVQSLSCVQHFGTPWTATPQASLSMTNSWSLLKLMPFESVMSSNHLILCRPLLLPPSIFPQTKIFSTKSVFHIMWPKYWSFSFSISPSNAYLGLTSFTMGFPGGSDGKASACDAGDLGLIPGSGRSPREGNGNPLQHSCLENPMDRGAW